MTGALDWRPAPPLDRRPGAHAVPQVKETWETSGEPTSLQHIERRVASSGVSQETLSVDHIRQIMNRLIFDSRLEVVSLTPALRGRFTDIGPYYRSSPQGISHHDHFTSMPCGVCPVFDECNPGGVISPETCIYLEQWWADDGQGAEEGGAAALSSHMAVEEMF